jgi:hypothetical protein
MARPILALLTAALLASATATSALAIEGGTPDGNGHPNVGLLAFDIDGPGGVPPFAICSGSVISDAAFLTAAHCIIPPLVSLPPNVTWAVTLVSGSPTDPIIPGGYFPDDYPACCALTVPESAIAYAVGVVVDPLYDPATYTEETGGEHDLAVVQFAPGTFAGTGPVKLVHPGQLAALAAAGNRRGPRLTITGYGGELRAGGIYLAGYRKTGRASFVDATSNWLVLTQTTDGLPGNAALCLGDSGSPQFLGGSNVQISVFHGGALNCRGTGYAQRLDTPAEQAFLAPFVGSD